MKKKKKFSQKELEYFSNGNPLYPDDTAKLKRLYQEKEEYLRSIGATDEQIEEGDGLCPEEFWINACDMVADLAQELLDERERKYDHWMAFIESIEGEIKQLKKNLKRLNNMETPSQEVFNEMKSIATDIWNTYDNQYGYVTEKLNRINSFDNIQDNAMVFYRMFDHINQSKFRASASPEVLDYIKNNL